MKLTSSSQIVYLANMCETCIREIDDLVTSGEFIAANEILEEREYDGYTCPTCLELDK